MERNLRKQKVGVVTSNKMEKTIAVTIERSLLHHKYGKFVKSQKSILLGGNTIAVHITSNPRQSTLRD